MLKILLLIVLGSCARAYACSNFLLNATFGQGCLSGRTMDFEVDLGYEIGYMSRGKVLTLLPICEGCLPKKATVQHGFAFLSAARSLFQSISKVNDLVTVMHTCEIAVIIRALYNVLSCRRI